MGLRDIRAKLPPGFRFHPSDEELVCHYLYNKIRSKGDDEETMKSPSDLVEIDLHVCEPWQLPDVAKLNSKEWYFLSFRDRKYATGYRANRATTYGYWKATGKDRTVIDPKTREFVGMRKTLVFYKNRAPNGIKTSWIMHEFRLEAPNMPPKEDWVLCRVFNKSKATQDNTNPKHSSYSNEMIASSPPNYNYIPNYTILTRPPSLPPPAAAAASSSSSAPSSTINDHHMIGLPSGLPEPLITLDYPQNEITYHSDGLLTHFYHKGSTVNHQSGEISSSAECYDRDHEDDYGDFFWDMNLEKTSGIRWGGVEIGGRREI